VVGYRAKNMRVSHQYDHYRDELIDTSDISLLSYSIGIQELGRNIIEHRIETARYYNEYLTGLERIYPPIEKRNVFSVYSRYFVKVESEALRDIIIERMRRRGIEPLVPDQGYPISKTLYPSSLSRIIPIAEMLSKTLIGLPINKRLSQSTLQELF